MDQYLPIADRLRTAPVTHITVNWFNNITYQIYKSCTFFSKKIYSIYSPCIFKCHGISIDIIPNQSYIPALQIKVKAYHFSNVKIL